MALGFPDHFSLLAPPGFSSLIVADFPALFAECRVTGFALLWRGSCDATDSARVTFTAAATALRTE
jgi:hypothetical protein